MSTAVTVTMAAASIGIEAKTKLRERSILKLHRVYKVCVLFVCVGYFCDCILWCRHVRLGMKPWNQRFSGNVRIA